MTIAFRAKGLGHTPYVLFYIISQCIGQVLSFNKNILIVKHDEYQVSMASKVRCQGQTVITLNFQISTVFSKTVKAVTYSLN